MRSSSTLLSILSPRVTLEDAPVVTTVSEFVKALLRSQNVAELPAARSDPTVCAPATEATSTMDNTGTIREASGINDPSCGDWSIHPRCFMSAVMNCVRYEIETKCRRTSPLAILHSTTPPPACRREAKDEVFSVVCDLRRTSPYSSIRSGSG